MSVTRVNQRKFFRRRSSVKYRQNGCVQCVQKFRQPDKMADGGRGLGPWWQSGGGRSQVCVTWVLCVGADVRGAGTAAPSVVYWLPIKMAHGRSSKPWVSGPWWAKLSGREGKKSILGPSKLHWYSCCRFQQKLFVFSKKKFHSFSCCYFQVFS